MIFFVKKWFFAVAVSIACAAFFAENSAFAAENRSENGSETAFLAKNGQVFTKIFISADDAPDGEISAALDLASWLSRVAESKDLVPVEMESDGENIAGIYVGNTRTSAKHGIFAPAGEGETFVIETRGNAIFIVGNTPAATRIAVGDFLREVLGISFVWPGENGAEWTPQAEIPFPKISIEHVPAFSWQLVGVGDDDWRAHLGFGTLPRFSHNLGTIFTKEVFTEKPYLAAIVHDVPRTNLFGGGAPQPNLASADAVPVVVAAAKKFFENNPDAPFFSVGINDSTSWDESEESARVFGDLKYFRNLPDRSDYYYTFVNRVADAFREEPELARKKVGCIAYLDVQNTPSFSVRENVVPVLCADRSMWVFPKFKDEDQALIRRWARSGVSVWGVYDYYYGSPFLFPRLFLKEEAEEIKLIHENGGEIFYAEGGDVVAFDAPKVWLASVLLRDPAADAEKALDDFYQKTFGAAAPAMKKFYDFSCMVWREQGGQIRWIKAWNNENSVEIFPPEKLTELRAIFEEAVAANREAEKKIGENPADKARQNRINERLTSVNEALTRAEKFTRSYFERKKLATAKTETLEDVLAVLHSPAWRFEEIYDDSKFFPKKHVANISAYQISDPRAAALIRVLDFLKKTNSAEEKSKIMRELEAIFGSALRSRVGAGEGTLSASDKQLSVISFAVPFFENTPDTVENFELESFQNAPAGDWRARKRLSSLRGWRAIFPASEKMECAPTTDNPHSGETCLRVAGTAEGAFFLKRYRVRGGQKVLAQVFARGNVSVGSISSLLVEFFDAKGKRLAKASCILPVGETKDWTRLVSLGEAPAGTATAEVSICAALQGDGDETFYDDFSVSVF